MNFPYVLPDGSFSCEKVCDSEECKRLLSTFEATCEAGKGLEKYFYAEDRNPASFRATSRRKRFGYSI